jgi:hypothetical protein
VRGRSERLHPDAFVLQVGDGANSFPRQQLLAADMHTGQNRQRFTGIDRLDNSGRIIEAEVDLATGDFRRPIRRRIDIADIGKTRCGC